MQLTTVRAFHALGIVPRIALPSFSIQMDVCGQRLKEYYPAKYSLRHRRFDLFRSPWCFLDPPRPDEILQPIFRNTRCRVGCDVVRCTKSTLPLFARLIPCALGMLPPTGLYSLRHRGIRRLWTRPYRPCHQDAFYDCHSFNHP